MRITLPTRLVAHLKQGCSIKNEIHLSLSKGEALGLVLLDQSAAIDTIGHFTLLSCLPIWFGINGIILRWFRFHFIDYFQCIEIVSTISELRRLLYSVPQGSVLGAILFSLTTPLSKVFGRHSFIKYHFYAEDTQHLIHLTNKNVNQSLERTNRCSDDVKMVMNLKLNPDKTKFFIF